MLDDFKTKYSFTENEFEIKFNQIWNENIKGIFPSENKTAFILGGQPGASKSSLINNNAIIISGDDYRRYHPKFDEIQKNETTLSAKYTQAFSSKITESLINKASDKNYDTNVAIKVCDKDVSPQMARYTNKQDHDIVIENLANNVSMVFEKGLANKIYIQNREKEILNLEYNKELIKQNSDTIKDTVNKELNLKQKE